jgi:hypothetical protein
MENIIMKKFDLDENIIAKSIYKNKERVVTGD